MQYVDEKEIARLTGLAVQTLRNMRCQHRGFPYSKIGKSVRYDPAEIEAYLESRKIRPEEA